MLSGSARTVVSSAETDASVGHVSFCVSLERHVLTVRGSGAQLREPQDRAKCQPRSAPGSSCLVLAMQKVDGSSPFIRSDFKPFPAPRRRIRATQVPQTSLSSLESFEQWSPSGSSLRGVVGDDAGQIRRLPTVRHGLRQGAALHLPDLRHCNRELHAVAPHGAGFIMGTDRALDLRGQEPCREYSSRAGMSPSCVRARSGLRPDRPWEPIGWEHREGTRHER